MSMHTEAAAELIDGPHDYRSVTAEVARPAEAMPPRWWLVAMAGALSLIGVFTLMVGYLVWDGVGVWGMNSPNFWGFDILNMVFWVGIAHCGTAVTSFFTLTRQNWKNSINRIAEAMTIFSVACAAIYPGIHVGRMWMAYFFFPIPNQMAMWPNLKSPIFADFFALQAYILVSVLFWYLGMIPDLATLRDRAKNKLAYWTYGILSLGWRSSARHWNHYEKAYLLFAGISAPLVLCVCFIVSTSFAPSVIPGWHATIFPMYFLGGALAAGFAMLGLLLVVAREGFGFKSLITKKHQELVNRFTLACLLLVSYVYLVEIFIAWYTGNIYEFYAVVVNRLHGPYAAIYFIMLTCNVVAPQFFWSRRIRESTKWVLIISGAVTVGMWCERFVIVVMSLHRDFLPGAWGMYFPSWVEVLTFAGTIGIFFTMFLLFLKVLPSISIAEVKTLVPHRLHRNS